LRSEVREEKEKSKDERSLRMEVRLAHFRGQGKTLENRGGVKKGGLARRFERGISSLRKRVRSCTYERKQKTQTLPRGGNEKGCTEAGSLRNGRGGTRLRRKSIRR